MRLLPWLNLFLVLSANAIQRTNHVTSQGIDSAHGRVNSLKKYIRLASDIQDAEYDIYDVNLDIGLSIPGPTHRDYRVAVSLHSVDAGKWLENLKPVLMPSDVQWCTNLLKQNAVMRKLVGKPFKAFIGGPKIFLLDNSSSVGCMRIYQE